MIKIKFSSLIQSFFFAVYLGPKISEPIKGKLSFGAKVLQAGGIDKVFREYFAVKKDEKLVKAFQCYLSTTAGPIAGMLFISTEKIAFHSDRPLNLASPKGGSTRVPYKVIEAKSPQYTVVYQIENATQRYLDILKVKKIKFVHSAGVDPHKEDKECFSAGKFIQSR